MHNPFYVDRYISLVINAGLKSNPVTGAQHDGRAAREAGERGLVVTILNGRFTAERLRLANPSRRGAAVGPMLMLGQLCTRGCMRERSLRYLGGCVDGGVCVGCDDCARRGAACAVLQPVGRLHDLSSWVPGEAAAVHLLTWLSESGDELSPLVSLQSAPPPGAPPPFHRCKAHERLVDTLLACGGLRAEGRPMRNGLGSIVLVAVDLRVKQLLEFGGASLPVLLVRDSDDDEMAAGGGAHHTAAADPVVAADAAADAAADVAAARRAEVRAQRFREQYAAGVASLLACGELMREQLDDALPLMALETTDAQRALVLAAERGVAAPPPSASPMCADTPTIGSVRPAPGRVRNLFGPPSPSYKPHTAPEPPLETSPSAQSPRSSLMGRVAAAMPGIRKGKRSGGSPSASATTAAARSPSLELTASPAVHVNVSDRGSPIGRGGGMSALRQPQKRRGVLVN